MFNISSQKDIITIERTLTLKKTGILPAGSLACTSRIDIGVEVKSADGGALLGKFDRIFNGKMASKAKQQDERIIKARQQLEKWVHLGESENKIKTYADTQQEDIIRDWNSFMRVDIKRAALESLEEALKKSKHDFGSLKLRVTNVDLKDNQMEFLTGVLNIAGRGAKGRVASAGMTTLVTGLRGLTKPVSAMRSNWERNSKLVKQGAQDAVSIQKSISAMRKASAGINARLARMTKISVSNAKVSTQGEKGMGALSSALGKHRKVAKLNDQDKVVIMLDKAQASMSASVKDAIVVSESQRLEVILGNISKLLAEAEKISLTEASAYAKALKATGTAENAVQQSGALIESALEEMKLKAKMNS